MIYLYIVHRIGDDSLHEDVSSSDPEADSQHFMAIIIECLALLGKLPDAVEVCKHKITFLSK